MRPGLRRAAPEPSIGHGLHESVADSLALKRSSTDLLSCEVSSEPFQDSTPSQRKICQSRASPLSPVSNVAPRSYSLAHTLQRYYSVGAAPATAPKSSSGAALSAPLGELPLGVTDFSCIAPDADAYFDRSEYLVKLEKRGPFVRALRPKGFGKSLFLSSLSLLHDCSTPDSEFFATFRGTAVARAVEKGELKRGRFIVLHLDLSRVNWTGRPEDVRASLQRHINDRIGHVWFSYAARLGPRPLGEIDPIKSFNHLLERVQQTSPPDAPVGMYLLVDAYDAVSFDVMGRLHREEHEAGTINLLHSLFAAFLKHRGPTGVGRIFIAGVTPLAIPLPKEHRDLGESIEDISLLEEFDRIFGITEDEIARALRLVNPKPAIVEMHLDQIRRKLNRYRPTPTSQVTLYNTTAALDYLDKVKSGILRNNKESSSALISSIDLAPGLLHQFAGSRAGRRVLETVLATGGVKFTNEEISTDYSLPQLYKKSEDLRGDAAESLLKSLLFYLGGLTFANATPCQTLVPPSATVTDKMIGAILERYRLQQSQLFDAVDLLVERDDPTLFLRLLEGTMTATVPKGDGHEASDMARQTRTLVRCAAHEAHPLEPGGIGNVAIAREAKAGKTYVFVFHAMDESDVDWDAVAKLPGLPKLKEPLTHEELLLRLQDEDVLAARLSNNNKKDTVNQKLQELVPVAAKLAGDSVIESDGTATIAFAVLVVAARRCLWQRL